ncbi:MAG TPA: hypothetical protein DCS13_02855 [Candidatus Margulisbacteria bacterium]|nr:MAG: hypothetical protein A2X43_02375 [Candidatus Margulisbacteria bacterium GWD2_39_127]HAR62382.1 hypothetical protein [Candidatus Margulisiibacteriota bacterium]
MEKKEIPFISRLFLPSIFDLIVVLVFVIMFMAHQTMKDFDMWWHLRTGQVLLQGIFPTTDIFSFTAYGKPWILHEWGSEVIFYLLNKTFGAGSIMLLRALLAAFSLGMVFKIMMRKRIDIFVALFLTIITLFATSKIWGERPHLFTVLFLTFLIYLYNEYKYYNNNKVLLVLPVLFIVWINLHGGYVIGFIYLGACIAAETFNNFFQFNKDDVFPQSRINRLIGITALSFLCTFINPNTYRGVLYPLLYVGDKMPDFHKIIQEWMVSSWENSKDFVLVFLFVISMLSLSSIKPKLDELALILVFGYFAFSAQRHVPLFVIVVLPIIAPQVQGTMAHFFDSFFQVAPHKGKQTIQKIINYFKDRSDNFVCLEEKLSIHGTLVVFIAIVSFFVLSGKLDKPLGIGIDKTVYPYEVVDYLKTKKLNGNMFNQYRWGGYLIWELPDNKVFIDGRLDIFQKKGMDEYYKVMGLQNGWEEVLKKYNINYILVDKEQTISKFLLRVSNDWFLEKEDKKALLFSRK